MPRKKNSDNLRPIRSANEAREMGKKGGIASGEARRKKKALKETFEELLSTPLRSPKMAENMQKLGLPIDAETTVQVVIAAAMVKEAYKGNVRAFLAIKDTMEPPEEGQKKDTVTERLNLMRRAFGDGDGDEEDDGDE